MLCEVIEILLVGWLWYITTLTSSFCLSFAYTHTQMLSLYRDPKGQYIFERSDSMRRPTLTGVSTLNDHERDRMMELERHCRDIESRLAKYEVCVEGELEKKSCVKTYRTKWKRVW